MTKTRALKHTLTIMEWVPAARSIYDRRGPGDWVQRHRFTGFWSKDEAERYLLDHHVYAAGGCDEERTSDGNRRWHFTITRG